MLGRCPSSDRQARSGRSAAPGRPDRWGYLVAVAVVLALVAAACGGADDDPADTTLPGRDESRRERVTASEMGAFDLARRHLAGPGTPLGAGLSVPEGAVLAGIPFPDLAGDGFRALLVVTGDPVATYNEVVSQALSLGMARGGACLGGEGSITCAGHLVDVADGESLRIELRRSNDGGSVVSGLALEYRPPGSESVGDGAGTTEAVASPTAPLSPVELPPTIPPPPDIDVGVALRPQDAPARHVELGTELVGLPGPCACQGTGWSFVVAVEGRVRDIIAAYGRQFADLGEPPDVSDRYRSGETTFQLVVGDGPQRAEIRAVAPDDGDTYLMVTVLGT